MSGFTMAWRAILRFFGLGKKRSTEQDGEPDVTQSNQKLPPRHHPYDEVSDDQLEQKRAGVKVPRTHPYDEVSEDQLEQKRAGVKVPRTHPYDEVSEDQLEERRAGVKGPRIHPYDEVSDAVLETNRQKGKRPNHAYDEVDLDRTMSKVNKVHNGGDAKLPLKKKNSPNSDLNYVEVEVQSDGSGSDKRRLTQSESTNYANVRRNSAGQTVLLSE